MEKFYVIKLINTRNGERGYVIHGTSGIILSINGVHPDVTQFESEIDARIFIKNNRLERNGMTAHIRSNQDLINEEKGNNLKTPDCDLFYIENNFGEKLFFDSKMDGYLFKYCDIGYPVWKTKDDAQNFINSYNLQNVSIKKFQKNN
jgi:hypothetical protein